MTTKTMLAASHAPAAALDPRAEALFLEHQQEIYCRTDRVFGHLMWIQWLAGIAFALIVSATAVTDLREGFSRAVLKPMVS